jgi:hypothetical protein
MKSRLMEDDDSTDTLNELTESLCDAYVGIIQGLRGGGKGNFVILFFILCWFPINSLVDAFAKSIPNLLQFVHFIAANQHASQIVKRSAIGIIG